MNRITLVLLPGLDGTGHLFKPLLDALPSYIKPLVIQYPPDQVLSQRDLVKYVEDRIPVDEDFVLLAESFSGAVAVELSASHPANLKALILCTSFVTSPTPRAFRFLRFILTSQLFKLRPPQFFVRYFLLGRDASLESINTFWTVLKSVSPEVLSSRLRAVLTVDARVALRECQVPILYLAAMRDRLVGVRKLMEIKSLALTVEVKTIDAPHFLLQREPIEAIAAIDSFLRRVVRNI